MTTAFYFTYQYSSIFSKLIGACPMYYDKNKALCNMIKIKDTFEKTMTMHYPSFSATSYQVFFIKGACFSFLHSYDICTSMKQIISKKAYT